MTNVLRLGGGSMTPAADNPVICGQGTLCGTNIFATSGVMNTSDARDKTKVRPLDRGLAERMRLKPVRYLQKLIQQQEVRTQALEAMP
ncbi:MAG: tail fiber domain-containing protein [Flavobacteriales bacterium]|nr:tail fiber domain-containing protein [Flavobacteriales bacterium]